MTELPDIDAESLDALRARRLLQISILVAVGLSVAMVGYFADHNWLIFSLLMLGVGLLLLCHWLSRRGRVHLANIFFLYGLTSLVGLLMWVSEGMKDVALLGFPALLVLAGLLVRTGALFTLLAAMLVYLVALTLATDVFHWRSNGYTSPPLEQMRDVLTILTVSGLAVWLISSDLQKLLTRLEAQITRYRESQAELTYLSQHDNLTGLANRTLGRERIERAIAVARRQQRRVALLFVDLDNFKSINDSLGHAAGDEFLRQVAQRLLTAVRASDVVARQGGDEFVLGLTDVGDVADASAVATAALQRMEGMFSIRDTEVSSSCSIGIAVFPEDGEDYESLLRKADTAMYRAKEAGRNLARFFDAGMQDDLQHKLQLVASLRQALVRAGVGVALPAGGGSEQRAFGGGRGPVAVAAPDAGIAVAGALHCRGRAFRFDCRHGRLGVGGGLPRCGALAARRTKPWWWRSTCRLCSFAVATWMRWWSGHCGSPVCRDAAWSWKLPSPRWWTIPNGLCSPCSASKHWVCPLPSTTLVPATPTWGICSDLQWTSSRSTKRLSERWRRVHSNMRLVAAIVQMAKALNLTCHAEGIEDEAVRDALRALGCELGQGYWFARPQTLASL